ncbi:MAG TPA: histidine phosphatase family protein [Thermoanaerobaculia bacterium]|nr:histidine phosphatase family protein [Thermoanaerobaculia bacterium]
MERARLLLVRHGHRRGDAAERPIMVGQADYPLSSQGWRQARALVRGLAAEPIAAAYASPLRRALSTARAALAGRDVPLHRCAGLLEIDCGAVDGWSVDEVKARYPERWTANERQDDDGFRWPGGESYAELRRRVLAACDAIAARQPGATVLVVSHAGAVNQVIGHLEGSPAARWELHRPRNCTVTEVLWAAGEGRIVRYDDDVAGVAEEG